MYDKVDDSLFTSTPWVDFSFISHIIALFYGKCKSIFKFPITFSQILTILGKFSSFFVTFEGWESVFGEGGNACVQENQTYKKLPARGSR
jgi:hypothetical protein